jgi:hypothetical protein
VARKITNVPAQTGLTDGEIETLTGWFGLTVIVTVFDVDGLPTAQEALEVARQVMASAFTGT